MSGVTLLRKIRQSPDLYDLPVMMFTAMSGSEDESQAMYAGAQDYIRKPFEPRGLTSRIQRVLSKRRDQPSHTDLQTYLARSAGWEIVPEQPSRRII